MMMMQMPVVLLIEAMRPVSLFRTMLAGGTGTGAVGTVREGSIAAVLLLLVLLLQKEVMLLLVVGVGQPTATGRHTQLLLLVTAGGKFPLTVDTSWH